MVTFGTHEDAEAWIRREFPAWTEDNRSLDTFDALLEYKADGYRQINEALRNGVPESVTDLIERLGRAIRVGRIPEEVEAFRGIADWGITQRLLNGVSLVEHRGFSSVTLREAVARRFLDHTQRPEDPSHASNTILAGPIPAGTFAAPLDLVPSASPDDEAELLLLPGATFVVNSVTEPVDGLVLATGEWRPNRPISERIDAKLASRPRDSQ